MEVEEHAEEICRDRILEKELVLALGGVHVERDGG